MKGCAYEDGMSLDWGGIAWHFPGRLLGPMQYNITKGMRTYIVRIGGGGTSSPSSLLGEGTVHHADLDMTYLCKNHYKEHICQVDRILEVNCKVISELTGIPSLDYSFPVPTSSKTSDTTTKTSKTSLLVSVDYSTYSDRINATHAIEECAKRYKQKDTKKKKKKPPSPKKKTSSKKVELIDKQTIS